MKAKVKNDTLFKLQPVLSSELNDTDKVFVPSGSEYDLKFFAEAAGHHLRLELAQPEPSHPNDMTWYVAQSDIDLEGDSVTATVLQDTVLKRRPVLASDLSDDEKRFVAAGTELQLQSYAPAVNQSTKLTLAGIAGEDGDADIWFADTKALKLTGQRLMLHVISDTVFKARPVLASQLDRAEKVLIPKQTTLALQSYSEVEGRYLKVAVADTQLGEDDRFIWYAFAPDVELEGTEPNNHPQDRNPAGRVQTRDRGKPINLPGFQGAYYSNTSIIAGGYFTWAQATHGGTRIPASAEVVYGMIRIAEALEEIRVLFGNKPIEIVSWYRDPATNLQVGGTKNSRHLTGDGVNFIVHGLSPQQVYAQLDPWWGARGGLASAAKFTHIDARGYRARWAYGF
ncbi:D-Ala-D-Ala carboxypeptidase family metallohydrolase [Leptolyngbya iicbica]|uniref:Peptidase M15 family protein n=2 Tax=Cyanophyceae TaxID=3028117 RepID=A0A4Q7E9Y1_9CYAN|nr:D-Ala-D-Ala carboxypeptidase family metallohydrolase [Leptolyngbya sp. LK]RZM79323.1 peptidase M15 family protein [Leptolyngbya sp. LK]